MRCKSVVCLVSFLLPSCSQCKQDEIRPSEKAVVAKAVQWYGDGKMSDDDVLRQVKPAVVYLPTMTCVGLNLRGMVLGGDTTVCFDKSGKQVLSYVNGD
jgi:hypothetical protein